MRLSQLRDFIGVVEAGSIREAARRLGVSQPAVTKSIRQLEDELSVTLVRRTPRGVDATRAGRAFLARARVVQSELRKAQEELEQLEGDRGGDVAAGMATVAGALLVSDAIAQYRRERPEGRVRLVEGHVGTLLPMVRDESLDFAITHLAPSGTLLPGLTGRPLFRVRLVAAARPSHPMRGARSLAELVDWPWLVFVAPGRGGVLETALQVEGLPMPRSIIHCDSYAFALSLLATQDILGLVAPQVLALPALRGLLHEVPLARPLPPLAFGLYRRADSRLTPAAEALACAFTAVARRLARSGRARPA